MPGVYIMILDASHFGNKIEQNNSPAKSRDRGSDEDETGERLQDQEGSNSISQNKSSPSK